VLVCVFVCVLVVCVFVCTVQFFFYMSHSTSCNDTLYIMQRLPHVLGSCLCLIILVFQVLQFVLFVSFELVSPQTKL
jgi:hypothetical protein